jgi:hypothetical protein
MDTVQSYYDLKIQYITLSLGQQNLKVPVNLFTVSEEKYATWLCLLSIHPVIKIGPCEYWYWHPAVLILQFQSKR